MIKNRILLSSAVLAVGAALVLTMSTYYGAFARQDVDSDETLAEQAAALAAESGAVQAPNLDGLVLSTASGGGFELFVGVDDTTVPAYRIDPTTNISTTAFVGFEVWGSAYDPANDIVYFNSGSTLYEWPVGGAVSTVGTITDPGFAAQSMTGLAFYNGELYGVKNVANEAVWKIDVNTLIATVFIDYVDADYDFGGFAIDQATGRFYATNDDTTPHGSGLYHIATNGIITQVAAYPVGQTDIDGLAVGDGKAFLVIDEPGFIYVFDFFLNDYITPLNNPWTTAEVFAAGAWIEPLEAAIELRKTVGLDPGVCAATDVIAVPANTQVTYCFEVENTGDVTLNLHDLVDSELGVILNDFPFALIPGASAFLTETTTIMVTTVNVATWTAFNAGPGGASASDSDSATVTVTSAAEIELRKTVGLDPGVCAATDAIAVPANTQVTYCFEVENTGDVTLNLHDLVDSELGVILNDFPFALIPGASAFLTETTTIMETTVNVATWTAFNAGPGGASASDSDSATVTVTSPAEIDVDPTSLSSTQTDVMITEQVLTIRNLGTDPLSWNAFEDESPVNCNVPDDMPWLDLSVTGGNINPGGDRNVTVTFDSIGLSPGNYSGAICITSNDPDASLVIVAVQMTVIDEFEIFLPIAVREP